MQIVIDIPEEIYENINNHSGMAYAVEDYLHEVEWAIKNGTPLPKGHGKIGDIDRLYEVFLRNVVGAPVYKQLFVNAPTILERSKE